MYFCKCQTRGVFDERSLVWFRFLAIKKRDQYILNPNLLSMEIGERLSCLMAVQHAPPLIFQMNAVTNEHVRLS